MCDVREKQLRAGGAGIESEQFFTYEHLKNRDIYLATNDNETF